METSITYQNLLDFYSLRLQEKLHDKAPATLKVIKSYLGLIHNFTGKTWKSEVGQEFLSEHDFGNFLDWMTKNYGLHALHMAPSTIRLLVNVFQGLVVVKF